MEFSRWGILLTSFVQTDHPRHIFVTVNAPFIIVRHASWCAAAPRRRLPASACAPIAPLTNKNDLTLVSPAAAFLVLFAATFASLRGVVAKSVRFEENRPRAPSTVKPDAMRLEHSPKRIVVHLHSLVAASSSI